MLENSLKFYNVEFISDTPINLLFQDRPDVYC